MLSATLLTALVLAPGQLFKDLPVMESSVMRLHVGKRGCWTMAMETKAHTRTGGDDIATKEFFEESGEQTCEELSRIFAAVDFSSEVKVMGENPATIVQTVTGKGDDPADLLQLLRVQLYLERCTFSWNRECFEVSGFPPKPPETGIVGALLGAMITAVSSEPGYRDQIVLTTDGRFVVDHMPCEIEDEGRRLILDISRFYESPEQKRTLRIEGLGE